MVNDIIKQIVLKMRVEGSQEVAKAGQNLSKGFDAKNLDLFLKRMQDVNKTAGKLGGDVAASFQKVNTVIKDLNDRQLKVTQEKLNLIAKDTEKTMTQFKKLEQGGASPKILNYYASRAASGAQQAQELMSNMPPPPPPPGGAGGMAAFGGGGISGSGIGAGQIVAAIAAAAGAYGSARQVRYDWRSQAMRDESATYQETARNRRDVFSGNMERAVMARSGGTKVAEELAKKNTDDKISADRWKGVAGAVAGIGMGALAGATMGSAIPIVGTAAGAVAGGLYGAYQQAGNISNVAMGFTEKRQQGVLNEERQKAYQNVKEQSLNVELYNRFREKAGMRFQTQRQLGMTDEEAYGFTQTANAIGGLKEQEASQLALNFRRFGSSNAQSLATQSGRLAREQGSDVQQTAGMLNALAMQGAGGAAKASENLEKIFIAGVKGGIEDSGLADEFKSAVVGLIQNQPGKVDAGAAAAAVMSTQLGTPDAYSLSQSQKAFQVAGGFMGQGEGGLRGQMGFSQALGATSGDVVSAQVLQGLTAEQLASGGTAASKALGITPEAAKEYGARQFENAAQIGDIGRSKIGTLLQKMQKGEAITKSELAGAGIAMDVLSGGKGQMSEEAATGAALSQLLNVSQIKKETLKVTDAEGNPIDVPSLSGKGDIDAFTKKVLGATEGTAAGKQEQAERAGEGELNKMIRNEVAPQMGEFAKIFKEEMVKSMRDAPKEGYKEAFEGVAKSANELAAALSNAASKINTYGSSKAGD